MSVRLIETCIARQNNDDDATRSQRHFSLALACWHRCAMRALFVCLHAWNILLVFALARSVFNCVFLCLAAAARMTYRFLWGAECRGMCCLPCLNIHTQTSNVTRHTIGDALSNKRTQRTPRKINMMHTLDNDD